MINIASLTPAGSINVTPSDDLYEEAGKNSYDFIDAISELIDNSISARRTDEILNVFIKIVVSESDNRKAIRVHVKDDGTGISREILPIAICLAGKRTDNSLNEHGMGMKQAISAIGKLHYLATKTVNDDKLIIINKFKFGELSYYEMDPTWSSGTEIVIDQFQLSVPTHLPSITNSVVPKLGARFRRFLRSDNRILDLSVIVADEGGTILYEKSVSGIGPVYFHPYSRTNKPVIDKFEIRDPDFVAELTFGYAPRPSEFSDLGLTEPGHFDPYSISLTHQGLDLIMHDRVILFYQLERFGIVTKRHNDYNYFRGELVFKKGFSTTVTKNQFYENSNFTKCLEKVSNILNGRDPGPDNKKIDYIRQRSYPEAMPEKLIRDRLKIALMNDVRNPCKDVYTEYPIPGVEGNIDVLADGVPFEIKREEASGLDIYQLFMYMDVGNYDKGFFVAKDYKTSAEVARDHIERKHGKSILLTKLTDYNINMAVTQAELNEYY